MDDRKAFLAAIIANPDEDTPRLALADYDVDAILTNHTFANLKLLSLTLPTRISSASETQLLARFGKQLSLDYLDEDT